MIRLQAGYYQDIFLGEILAVARRKSKWECQWQRGGAWIGGFKSRTEAAKHARYMIAMKQREAKQ